jgi:hypothetical protein
MPGFDEEAVLSQGFQLRRYKAAGVKFLKSQM